MNTDSEKSKNLKNLSGATVWRGQTQLKRDKTAVFEINPLGSATFLKSVLVTSICANPNPHSRPYSSTLFDSTTDQEFSFLGADQKKGMQLLD